MQRVFHYEGRPGMVKLARPGQAGLHRLEFGLLRVPRDEMFRFRLEGREAVLVILSGACMIEVDGKGWPLERVSVFAEPAMALYVPRHLQYIVTASRPTDLAVLEAEATRDFLPRLVTRDQIKVDVEGREQDRRRVHTIVGEEFPNSRLLVGETFVEPGCWASYPPHKHDEDNYPYEVRLEQISYFQIDPPQGFALQYLYSQDHSLDQVYAVHNDDVFVSARGYHPIAVAPGYSLYYLWGMAGDGHVIRQSVDPAHAWVEKEEAGAPQPVPVSG